MKERTGLGRRLTAFVQCDHRYVYLGGGALAAITLALLRTAPSASSFLGGGTFLVGLLEGLCLGFLLLGALALVLKLTHWRSYGATVVKRPGVVTASRWLSYVVAGVFVLAAADRLLVRFWDLASGCIALESNPQAFVHSMIYMTWNGRAMLATGVWTTVRLALMGTAVAFVFGILMAFFRIQTPDKRDNDLVKLLKWLARNFAKFYIFVIRGTPMMVQALIFYYAGFNVFTHFTTMSVSEINQIWSFFVSGFITISLNSTAYLAEVFRGGIQAVDAGQTEAARSLGMTGWKTMVQVVFPQAIKNSIPAIGNEFIINIKDSSVLSVIGVMDLMFATKSISGIYFRSLEIYVTAAILYLVLTYLSSLLLKFLSRKLDMPVRGIPSSN